ncbi:MAG: cytochrome c oxidase cbb3-type subunit [Verrucomicrobiota bacterium]|jgi:cbb3-type cytochrome oxidase cytochrome c subunit
MKGLTALFLGIFGTFAFSWVGLTVVPNYQIGHLDPQSDEEGTDVYPLPKSGMAERGRRVYAGNGCFYCHSRWVRPDYSASDIDRKWNDRRSAPRDYIFDRPVLLGKMRTGPDLSSVGHRAPAEDQNAAPSPGASASPVAPSTAPAGKAASPAAASPGAVKAQSPTVAAASAAAPKTSPGAAPSIAPDAQAPSPMSSLGAEKKPNEAPIYSAAWHHRHLYSPRNVTLDSNMPAYRFLYEKRRIEGEPSDDALKLTGAEAPPAGWEIVPTYDAQCLVAFLMSLDQSHPLKEASSSAAPATAPAAAAPPAAPAPPPK